MFDGKSRIERGMVGWENGMGINFGIGFGVWNEWINKALAMLEWVFRIRKQSGTSVS